jgi:hypothetical protein
MAATTPPTQTVARQPRFRLSTMEVLGFIETPGTAVTSTVTWVDTASHPIIEAPAPPQPPPAAEVDLFAGWKPQELATRFTKGRVRWGMVVFVTGLLAMTTLATLWVYQRPQIEAENARQTVRSGVSEVTPALTRLAALNQTLTSATIDAGEVNSVMLALDAGMRRLFAAAPDLADSDGAIRTRLLDATGDIADALRLFGDSYAYRSGVIPVLVAPALETDPGLVSLEDAASDFSEWQARFEAVRTALPEGQLDDVKEALGALSPRLPDLQGEYLDALRLQDAPGAEAVVSRLADALGTVGAVMLSTLEEIKETLNGLVAAAGAGLAEVASLLG